jgi:hypothetical protein
MLISPAPQFSVPRLMPAALLLLAALVLPVTAIASLQPLAVLSGNLSLSVDGVGSTANPMTVGVTKPGDFATVSQAWLISAATPFSEAEDVADGLVSLDGTAITWDDGVDVGVPFGTFRNRVADVTDLVKDKLDGASSGLVTFELTEATNDAILEDPDSDTVDGEVLVVVFDDPEANEETTVVLLFGGQKVNKDRFSIQTEDPFDPTREGAMAVMGVGIGFGDQGREQSTLIDVNGRRLTSAAGGQDDGESANGSLITVGGLGDDIANPVDPDAAPDGPESDDELYDLLSFVVAGENTIVVDTSNPTFDDNLFFAYFVLTGIAEIGEILDLDPVEAEALTLEFHTVTATVTDTLDRPVVDRLVNFRVHSGPNAGTLGECDAFDCRTGLDGTVTFTYQGLGGFGDDVIAVFADVNENGRQEVGDSTRVASVEWELAPPTTTTTTLPEGICLGECGDPSRNGVITAFDAHLCLQAAVGLFDQGLCHCDANGNGSLESLDALLILSRAVKLRHFLNCPPADIFP